MYRTWPLCNQVTASPSPSKSLLKKPNKPKSENFFVYGTAGIIVQQIV